MRNEPHFCTELTESEHDIVYNMLTEKCINKEELRLKQKRKLALNHNIKHANDDKKKRKYMRFIVKRRNVM